MQTVIVNQPRRIVFGPGCAGRSGEDFAAAGFKRLYVVSSPRAAAQGGALIEAWRSRGAVVEVNTTVSREPEVALFEAVRAAAQAFRPDAIVGLGGGSPLDVAKLVAVMLVDPRPVREVFGVNQVAGRPVHLTCVPTTAGTGSEVSPNAVLLDEVEQVKKGAVSPYLVPDAAYVDPQLTVSVPAAVTAAVGVDALVHCVEGYANKSAHPLADMYALEGIRRIARSLATAVHSPGDLAARSDVMLGAMCGGFCLGPVNTAGIHALAAPLGARRIAHGVANAALMTHVIRFNLEAMPQRYADIANALGVAVTGSPAAMAEAGLRWLRGWVQACRVPVRLRDLNGLTEADLPDFAAKAMKLQRLLRNNPRELTEVDALTIYRSAW